MKYLITGGKGFIGSYIVERLSADNDVIVLDNEDSYGILKPDEQRKLYAWRTRNWNTKNVLDIKGDVCNRLDCLKAFSHAPDIVIHLAAYPRAKIVDQDPIMGVPKIVNGTTNLLWHASKWNCSKFVYISSSMIYGDFKDGTKEGSKTKPRNIYGEAKLAGERLVKLFMRKEGLNYNIVRPSGVYGPGDMPDRVVSKFFDNAMAGRDISVHNGANKVDFTYVEDTVDGIIKIAQSKVSNCSFNITAGNAATLMTLAEKVVEITKSESDINDTGNHPLYPMRGTLDITRARDLVDYTPKTTLDEGLRKYYAWLQDQI